MGKSTPTSFSERLTNLLLIQLLSSQWTKKDRNIEATRERAAAPTVLSFQTPQLPEFGECWVQSHDVRRIDWTDRVAAGIVEVLRLDTETLRVGLSAAIGLANLDRVDQGKPFTLNLGDTAHFSVQFRCQYYEDMWFERRIANVAWLSRFDSEVFRLRPFTYEHRFRAPFAQ